MLTRQLLYQLSYAGPDAGRTIAPRLFPGKPAGS